LGFVGTGFEIMTALEHLKSYMEEKGITQNELANRMGVENSQIYRWFNNTSKPTFPQLAKIIAFLEREGEL